MRLNITMLAPSPLLQWKSSRSKEVHLVVLRLALTPFPESQTSKAVSVLTLVEQVLKELHP